MENYKDLIVWKRSMELVGAAYRVAALLLREETFALSDQLRRSAVSIPSNIAEGYGRNSTKDYARFLSVARGSRYELETQLLLCVQLGYVQQKDIETAIQLGEEVGKMLNVIIAKLGF